VAVFGLATLLATLQAWIVMRATAQTARRGALAGFGL